MQVQMKRAGVWRRRMRNEWCDENAAMSKMRCLLCRNCVYCNSNVVVCCCLCGGTCCVARDTDVRPCVMRRVFVATRQAALVICCSSVLNWFDFATEGYVRCTGGTLFLIDVFWTHSL